MAAVFLGICFAQEPGRIVADTKLDLAIAPGSFLSHALHLWNPTANFGEVPNQAYGYLFPMGPFFLLGHAVHLPAWCVQRLWVAVLLTVAAWGIVRLGEALGIGSTRSRLIAGLAYALSPVIVAQGNDTANVLSTALLPFVVAPLVRGARSGSPRRAGARSGVAFALMGGTNAAVSLSVLPVPLLWLATRQRGARRRALAGWWVVAIALGSAWWAFALWLYGRYGLDFLKYTEQAASTTSTASTFEGLRGGSSWLNYYSLGTPTVPGGWILATHYVPLVASSALTAMGLFGLARKSVPERLFLVAAFSIGLLAIGVGYAGSFGGPLAHQVQHLLDGPLAPFRNVFKFAPVVALPLALGLAHGIGSIQFRWPSCLSRLPTLPRALPAGAAAAVVAAVVASSAPWIHQQFFPTGSFSQVPTYWSQLSSWLAAQPGNETALMVPASAFATYAWGRPLDEPMQALSTSPWAVRSLIPFGGIGSTRVMDAVERALDAGGNTAGLSAFLARAGIGFVVVRNDLDARSDGALSPIEVASVLDASPGLAKVAEFGPTLAAEGAATQWTPPARDAVALRQLPVIAVYKVGDPAPRASLYSAANPLVVSGGPDALLPMANAGLLGDRPVLLAGDGHAAAAASLQPGASWIVTDTLRRVDVTFGSVRQNSSYPLAPGQLSPNTGNPPQDWLVVPGLSHQTTAHLDGAKSAASSSYGSLGNLARSPANGPLAAFDGDPSNYWVADAANDSVGQWLSISFDHPEQVSQVTIRPLADGPTRPTVTQVRIETAVGAVTRPLQPNENPEVLSVPPGLTSWLKVTLVGVQPPTQNTGLLGAGLRKVSVPGVDVTQSLVTPSDEIGPFSRPGAQPPVYVLTSPTDNPQFHLGATNELEPSLQRVITVPRPVAIVLTGQVTPRSGQALDLRSYLLLQSYASAHAVHLPCGQGPPISVDGRQVATRVDGTIGDLSSSPPLSLAACGPATPLGPGQHSVAADDAGMPFRVSSLTIADPTAPPVNAPPPSQRSLGIRDWGAVSRHLVVGPGSPTYLAVAENYNKGWTASLDGKSLMPVRLDGWQQGWLVPAGAGGVVAIHFGPDALYRAGLLGGALFLCVLLALVLLPARRGDERPPLRGLEARTWSVAAGAAIVLALLSGLPALVLVPLLLLGLWRRSLLAIVALASFMAAAVWAAVYVSGPAAGGGAFSRTAQLLAITALASVLAAAILARCRLPRRWPRRRQSMGASGPLEHQDSA